MSVGSKVPDIPIIDVKTGEDTTLLAIIGNGGPPAATLADPLISLSLSLSLSLTHTHLSPPACAAGKKTVIDFYTSW